MTLLLAVAPRDGLWSVAVQHWVQDTALRGRVGRLVAKTGLRHYMLHRTRLYRMAAGLPSSLMSSTPALSSMHPPTGNDSPAFLATVDLIRSEHVTAARSSITSLASLEDLEEEIAKDCDALRSFLVAIQVGIHCHPSNSFIHPP